MCASNNNFSQNKFKVFKLAIYNYPSNKTKRMINEGKLNNKNSKKIINLSGLKQRHFSQDSNFRLKNSNDVFPNLQNKFSNSNSKFFLRGPSRNLTKRNSNSQNLYNLKHSSSRKFNLIQTNSNLLTESELDGNLSGSQGNIAMIKSRLNTEGNVLMKGNKSSISNNTYGVLTNVDKNPNAKVTASEKMTTKESIATTIKTNIIEGIDTPEELHFYYIRVIQNGKIIEEKLKNYNW